MNSIRSVGRALEYEEQRQRDALEARQDARSRRRATSTRRPERPRPFGRRSSRSTTGTSRSPTSSRSSRHDEWVDAGPRRRSRSSRGATRRASRRDYGLSDDRRRVADDVASRPPTGSRTRLAAYGGDAKKVVNWIIADLFGLLNEAGIELAESKIAPEQLAGLVKLVDAGTISGKQAKTVSAEMFATGKDADERRRGEGPRTDHATQSAIESVGRRGHRGERRGCRQGAAGNLGHDRVPRGTGHEEDAWPGESRVGERAPAYQARRLMGIARVRAGLAGRARDGGHDLPAPPRWCGT